MSEVVLKFGLCLRDFQEILPAVGKSGHPASPLCMSESIETVPMIYCRISPSLRKQPQENIKFLQLYELGKTV